LLEVDARVSTKFLGGVVAAYSVGQLVASPVLGAWADLRPTREPLIVSLCINVVFSVLYSYAGAFPQHVSGWVVLLCRALIGFGAGNAAIVRSYVSEATTEKERVGAMAAVSGSQAIGFIIGPALGLAFVPLKEEGWMIQAIRFHLNIYTGPGYLGGLLGVANILLLIFFFWERKISTVVGIKDKQMKKILKSSIRESLSARLSSMPRPKWDALAASASIALFFIILFVFAVFETIGTPLTMDEFAWTRTQAVLYNSICYAGLAVIAIISFVAVKVLTKWLSERLLWMVAMFIIAFGFFSLIPMGNKYPSVIPQGVVLPVPEGNMSYVNLTETVKLIGCRYPPQTWCISVNKINIFQYATALLLIAIGYPTSSVMCYSIYSKILGPTKQGTMMGVLTAAGSLARSLGPIFVSTLYSEAGPEVTFSAVVGIVAVSIIFMTTFYHRLVPHGSPHRCTL
jgi:ceroid-lipofuscinosis MFS transporter 7